MRTISTILIVVFGLVYYPLNSIYLKIQKWYLPMWKKDKIIYFAFAPLYWVLVIVVTIISVPYEALAKHLR